MKGSSRSIGLWAVTARVLLTFLMYAGNRASQIVLIGRRWGLVSLGRNVVAIRQPHTLPDYFLHPQHERAVNHC